MHAGGRLSQGAESGFWQNIPCFQPKKLTWEPRVSVPEGLSVPSLAMASCLVFLFHGPIGLTSEGVDQQKPVVSACRHVTLSPRGAHASVAMSLQVNSTILLTCSPGGQKSEISLAG